MVRIQKPTSNVEDGLYTLRIGTSKTVTVSDFKTGDDVERIEFTFLCLDGDSEGEEFTDLFTDSVGPRSKLGKMYRAALKVEKVPDDWDTEDIEGERFVAVVQSNESGYPRIGLESIKPAKDKPKRQRAERGSTPPVGQTMDEAKRQANLRRAQAADASTVDADGDEADDEETWDDETVDAA